MLVIEQRQPRPGRITIRLSECFEDDTRWRGLASCTASDLDHLLRLEGTSVPLGIGRRTLAAMESSGWFGVRCIFTISIEGGQAVYEERVTLWPAVDADDAIRLAEAEAEEYASNIDADYLGLAQAYMMADEVAAGAEVFSLMRTSDLKPAEYLSTYFDTGAERQTHHDAGPVS